MSHQDQTFEFSIRLEIQDWFKGLFNKTFGSDVLLQFLSNDEHFDVYTRAEITASENTISDVVEFIANRYDLLQYQLPWLGDNIYFSYYKNDKDIIQKILSTEIIYTNYTTNLYSIIGYQVRVYNFPQYLNDTEKIKLNEIFKNVLRRKSLFLTYPKVRTTQRQSSFHFGAKILMGYHGSYLKYLNLEDIISLEMANRNQEDGADAHLDHDIQKFLRTNWPKLYKYKKVVYNLSDFKINKVLCYFVQKYYNHLKRINISNILTTDEIQSLTQSYNIKIRCNNLIHIDFKTEREHKSIDFCAIYHFDPYSMKFYNYNSQYASENYTMKFNSDDSLEHLTRSTEFTYLVIKSQNNCAPSKTNSVLKYVTNNFIANQPISVLILYEFDLNHVPKPLLGSLVKMMAIGQLQFHKMNFHLETLNGILEQSAKTLIHFNKCHIRVEKLNRFRINSQKSVIFFRDMNIDLNLLNSLYNLNFIMVEKCQIPTTNSIDVTVKKEISDFITIAYTSFSETTLVQLLKVLSSVPQLIFESCNLTTNDLIKNNFFVLTNDVFFKNIIFKLNTFLRIFEKCKVKGRLKFTNCQFLLDDKESYTNQLELHNIKFHDIQFDLLTLLTILGFLGHKSKVWLINCSISRLDDNLRITKTIKSSYVDFKKCRLETNSLLKILSRMSKTTSVFITDCDVINSYSSDPSNLSNVVEIRFHNMTINSQLAWPILQTNSKITFDNCCLQFMADEFFNIPIHASIEFKNMTFVSSAQVDLFGTCTPNSTLKFFNCHFECSNLKYSNILIQSQSINFNKTFFKLEALLKVLTKFSEHTIVFIDACEIRDIDPKLLISPIRIKNMHFWNMNLQLLTLQCILKNFANLDLIQFNNCRILCADPNALLDIIIKPASVTFVNMNIDVHVFQALVLKCVKQLNVTIDNCRIVASSQSSEELLDIIQLTFENVYYSQDLLQLVQCLRKDCSVVYLGQLSNEAIIEICTKSLIRGKRLVLDNRFVTKTLYFELFAEYYREKAINFELDTDAEYDLPIDIVPRYTHKNGKKSILDPRFSKYDWDKFKIKFVEVNDVTVKLEFMKNDEVVDLFYLLNDLPDDSDECLVDYS